MLQSATATIRVLLAFEHGAGALGVSDIAALCGLSRSHVAKILASLRAEGAVTQTASRKYRLSQRMFSLGNRFLQQSPLVPRALEAMQALSRETGHSITLTMREGGHITHLLAVDGPAYPAARWRVGQEITLHTSAAARVLLAHMHPRHVRSLLRQKGMPELTPRTVTDPVRFMALLDEVRRTGWAYTAGEGVQDLAGLAVPVFGGPAGAAAPGQSIHPALSYEITAALAVIAPVAAMPVTEIGSICAKLQQTAQGLGINTL